MATDVIIEFMTRGNMDLNQTLNEDSNPIEKVDANDYKGVEKRSSTKEPDDAEYVEMKFKQELVRLVAAAAAQDYRRKKTDLRRLSRRGCVLGTAEDPQKDLAHLSK